MVSLTPRSPSSLVSITSGSEINNVFYNIFRGSFVTFLHSILSHYSISIGPKIHGLKPYFVEVLCFKVIFGKFNFFLKVSYLLHEVKGIFKLILITSGSLFERDSQILKRVQGEYVLLY